MELGSLVWFSSREHPFAVRQRHCVDLECPCTDVWLTFTEVDLQGGGLPAPLTFEIRVNLRNGRERRPRKRSTEVAALVHEFLVRLPKEQFEEMIDRRRQQRTMARRLKEYQVDPSNKGKLVSYSEILYEEGGMLENGRRFSFFFVHDGRDYLIEDYYCPSPACDCREFHVEFWERIELPAPKVELRQCMRAVFTLDGRLDKIPFCEDDPQVGRHLAGAWRSQCDDQFKRFCERYKQVKAIGQRSMPSDGPARQAVDVVKTDVQERWETSAAGSHIGRNSPCPCGSGRKYKRCCGRR